MNPADDRIVVQIPSSWVHCGSLTPGGTAARCRESLRSNSTRVNASPPQAEVTDELAVPGAKQQVVGSDASFSA